MEIYFTYGEWLIEQKDFTIWIYKEDVCFCRIPCRKHKSTDDLKSLFSSKNATYQFLGMILLS